MKLFYSIFTILFLLITSNVGAQVASIVEGCLPLEVDFTAPAGYSSFFWDFGDGATANIENPTNTFLTAGSYNVLFKETSNGPTIGSITINVYNKPTPTFINSVSEGCAPLTVGFTNTTSVSNGINILTTSWVFTNGGTASGPTPNYTFTNSGTFGLSLAITTNFPSCNTSLQYSDVVTVANPPAVAISTNPNPAFACDGPLTVSFQNTSSSQWGPLSYSWDFDNGNFSNANLPPAQTYTGDGTYTVVLTVTDTIGCSNSNIAQVNIGGPTASFSIDDTVCLYEYANLNNLSPPGNYTWTFDNGAVLSANSSVNAKNPFVYYKTGGYHTIKLELGGPCPHDTTITFYVEDVDPSFTITPDFSCSNPLTSQFIPNDLNGASYEWFFMGMPAGTSSEVTPFHTYAVIDTHEYSINGATDFTNILILTSQAGCKDTAEVVSTIHKPNALIYPDVVDGCKPLTVNFFESSTSFSDIVNWEWHFGDGTVSTSTTGNDTSHVYTEVGYYNPFIIITNANGCIDTSYTIPIRVGDTISPDFSVSATAICPGDSVSFTDITLGPYADSIDTWHYYSDNNKLFSCFQEPNPTWVYEDSIGAFDITFEVGFNGCYSDTTIANAIVVSGPIAGIDYSIDCGSPMVVNFENKSQDASSVMWLFGDGNSSTNSNPSHTYASTGDYIVLLIASNSGTGCADDTVSIIVHIRDVKAGFTVEPALCKDVSFTLDATNSVDVFENCGRGYSYYFTGIDERPLMGDLAIRTAELNETGNVEIMLVVTDINHCTDTARNYTKVYAIDAAFSLSDTSICFPANITGTDISITDTIATSWSWHFPDSITSTLQNPTVALNSNLFDPHDSVLFVVVNAAGCTDTTKILLDFYQPYSTIEASSTSICTGMDIDFTATDFTEYTGLDFAWDFGNGNTSNQQNPTSSYNNVGTYDVTMTYTEIGSGCNGTVELEIEVGEFPDASFTSSVDGVLYVCPDENVLFTNTSAVNAGNTFNWSFGNGLFSVVENPGTVYTENGTYTVQFILSSPSPFGCQDTASITINVQSPDGDFVTTLGLDTICRLDSVKFTTKDMTNVGQYYWDFGDGTGAGEVDSIWHQYKFVPPSGKTVAKLIMSNPDGSCPVTKSKPINIFEVVANFIRNGNDIDTAVCPQPFPFTNASLNAFSYYWDFGNGETSALKNPPPQIYNPGTYDVTLGVLNGVLNCTDTVTKTIIVFENPLASIIGDTICEGESVTLETAYTDPSYRYLWTSDPVFSVNNSTTPSVVDNPTITTNYFLTVTDTNDCFALDETFVEVYNPITIPDFDTTLIIGDSIFLPMPYDSDNFTFTWTPTTGLSCTDCANPYVQPLTDIVYTLVISDNYGCFADEASYKITINPETFIKLPTTFTPNGDGRNDVIYVEGWGIKELITYKIFNRWGELVFETTDKEVGWDGYYKGILQNNDVYLVQVVGLTWKDEEKTIEHYINLMR